MTHGDVLAKFDAVPLGWGMVTRDPVTGAAAQRCSVIPLSSLARREYIVCEFAQASAQPSARHYVNPFKY
jgi:hypothetical protein